MGDEYLCPPTVEVKGEGETLGRELKHRVRERVRVEAEGEEETEGDALI